MFSSPFVLSLLICFGVGGVVYGIYQLRKPAEIRRRVESAFEGPIQTYEELELQSPFVDRVLRPFWDRMQRWGGKITPASNIERVKHGLIVAGNPRNLT